MCIVLLIIAPAVAELTPYQMGIIDGLRVGLFMGRLEGQGSYVTEAANSFNSYLGQFNQFLGKVFGNNTTAINANSLQAIGTSDRRIGGPLPNAYGRIGEYPAEAFYTATGSGPDVSPSSTAGMGWV